VAFLSLAAVMLSANVAVANSGSGGDEHARGGVMTKLKLHGQSELKIKDWDHDTFVVMGTVKSIAGSKFTIAVDHMAPFHRKGAPASNQPSELTITTDSDTKISALGDSTTAASLQVGYRVVVKGEKSNTDYVADWVQIKAEKAEKKKIMGEVTAKTNTSITIKNNVSGEVTTVPVNDETKVAINGEAKTMADVQVGDKGRVKVKTVLGVVVAKFVNLFR
jgi:hypothetical protein